MIRIGSMLAMLLLFYGCATQQASHSNNYPPGSFGPLVDDPHFDYWEDRHEKSDGNYIYDFGYEASASLGPDILKKYIVMRATRMCGSNHYTLDKYEDHTGVSLCGYGTELRFVDATIDCE